MCQDITQLFAGSDRYPSRPCDREKRTTVSDRPTHISIPAGTFCSVENTCVELAREGGELFISNSQPHIPGRIMIPLIQFEALVNVIAASDPSNMNPFVGSGLRLLAGENDLYYLTNGEATIEFTRAELQQFYADVRSGVVAERYLPDLVGSFG